MQAILFFAGLIISTYTHSEEFCAPENTAVYFGNGVGMGDGTFGNAVDSRIELQSLFLGSIQPEERENYIFNLAYNFSGGTLTDVIESARQAFGNEWPTLLTSFFLGNRRLLSLLPNDQRQNFNDLLTSKTIQDMVAPVSSNFDLRRQVESYKSDILEGRKVIVVSHSQGNIFANLAFQRLNTDQQQYFSTVPVASPESFSRKSLVGHVRFSDDIVIIGVAVAKTIAGLSLPLNVNDEDNVDVDFTSHQFRDAYLFDTSSREFILNGILSSESQIISPPVLAEQGTVTVTLNWGSNRDVDLHIFEPTGTQVFYSRRSGDFGFLDVDDTDGFGPEHYYLSCETLRDNPAAVGKYRFAANYFSGETPEIARVTVKTPNSVTTYFKSLSAPRGSSGNSSPVPVANVVVSKNPQNGRFDFFVEGR